MESVSMTWSMRVPAPGASGPLSGLPSCPTGSTSSACYPQQTLGEQPLHTTVTTLLSVFTSATPQVQSLLKTQGTAAGEGSCDRRRVQARTGPLLECMTMRENQAAGG